MYDEQKEAYASLADEMNDGDVVWVESDWDKEAVKLGKAYAEDHDLPWPPRMGDYDRFYEAAKRTGYDDGGEFSTKV
jgi:hypothetical protein